jgi:hypothetical protein
MGQRGRGFSGGGSSPMESRRWWVTRRTFGVVQMAIGAGGTALMLVVAVQAFVDGHPGVGAFALFGAILVSATIWRGKLRYDIARRELEKFR